MTFSSKIPHSQEYLDNLSEEFDQGLPRLYKQLYYKVYGDRVRWLLWDIFDNPVYRVNGAESGIDVKDSGGKRCTLFPLEYGGNIDPLDVAGSVVRIFGFFGREKEHQEFISSRLSSVELEYFLMAFDILRKIPQENHVDLLAFYLQLGEMIKQPSFLEKPLQTYLEVFGE